MSRMASAVRSGFNPRTHTGATGSKTLHVIGHWFQSTHPYGCDHNLSGIPGRDDVSIHAPIRVRHGHPPECSSFHQFQSTHPYGCDCTGQYHHSLQDGFNPRTHTGATMTGEIINMCTDVSIHAPIRVRRSQSSASRSFVLFQSTHPYGCDMIRQLIRPGSKSFNPRTHTGATRRCRFSGASVCFNPRTHTGAT